MPWRHHSLMEYHRGSPLIVARTLYFLSLRLPCVWPRQVPTMGVRQLAVGRQTPSNRVLTGGVSADRGARMRPVGLERARSTPDRGSVWARWGPEPGKKRVHSPSGDPKIIFPTHGWHHRCRGVVQQISIFRPKTGFPFSLVHFGNTTFNCRGGLDGWP